jgi:hypothetical protein
MATIQSFSEEWWRGLDSNQRRHSQQIYSLPLLAAQEPRLCPSIPTSLFNYDIVFLNRFQLNFNEKRHFFKKSSKIDPFSP